MKLLYLCHDPIPSPETRTEQLVQTMAALARHGVETTLVVPGSGTPRPSHDRAGEIRSFYGLADDSDFPAGILDLAAPPGRHSVAARLLQDFRAVRAARGREWDVVYTRDELALTLCVLAGLPAIFETYRADLNELRRYWLFRRICYPRPNLLGVVAHSRYATDAFIRGGIEEQRVHLGYNGFDPVSFLPLRTRDEARRELGLRLDSRIVVYTGHVAERKGSAILLSIAALLPKIEFLVVGAVPGSKGERDFLDQARRLGVANVELRCRVPPPSVPVFLYAADGLIVPPTAAPLRHHRRTVLPMKIFTYMAAGRPILAPDLPDVREVLADGHNALLVPPDRPRESAAALGALLEDGPRSARLAQQAAADARRYTWEARAERLARFLRERHETWQSRPAKPA